MEARIKYIYASINNIEMTKDLQEDTTKKKGKLQQNWNITKIKDAYTTIATIEWIG